MSIARASRAAAALLLASSIAAAQDRPRLDDEVAALRAADAPWRAIAWRSCLLESMKEGRASKKPLVLWVFIDRPADDERC